MSEPSDRVLTRPSAEELVTALAEVVREVNGLHERRTLPWPLAKPGLDWFLGEVRDRPEGVQQWNGGEKGNRGVPHRSAVQVSWWTDRAGGKHFRLHGRRDTLMNVFLKDLLCPYKERPPLARVYPDLVFQRVVGEQADYQCLCPCGVAGPPWQLGWMGPCCGPCHDRREAGELADLPARQAWRLHSHSDYPRQLSFSPDGSLLALSGGSRHQVLLWDTARGCLHAVIQREAPTLALFSPTGDTLALVANNGDVYLGTPADDEPRLVARAEAHPDRVSYSPDGRYLGFVGPYRLLLVDLDQGTVRRLLGAERVYQGALVFTPDGRLVVGAPLGQITVWDVESGAVVRETALGPEMSSIGHTLSPAGDLLLLTVINRSHSHSPLRCFSFPALTPEPTLDPLLGDVRYSGAAGVSPDGSLIALATSTGLQVQQLRGRRHVLLRESHGEPSYYTSAAFSPTGDLLAVLLNDHSVRLWPASVFTPTEEGMRHEG